MTKTAKLNLTFLIIAIFSIGGSYAYVLLTNGMELPIYADLLVAQLLILLPAWVYTKKEHINLYKEIRHRRLRFGVGSVFRIAMASLRSNEKFCAP